MAVIRKKSNGKHFEVNVILMASLINKFLISQKWNGKLLIVAWANLGVDWILLVGFNGIFSWEQTMAELPLYWLHFRHLIGDKIA